MIPLSASRAAEPLKIVAFGDSLTAGYMLPASAAFPSVLQRRLREAGRNVEIANAGVSGDTAADGLARLDWSVPDGTQLVIVELGANDMLRGQDPAATKKTLTEILSRIKARGIDAALAGTRVIGNWGPDYKARFEAIYPALAAQFGVPLYPGFMDGVTGNPDLVLSDGLHPNPKGVEKLVDGFLPFIAPIVDQLAAKNAKPVNAADSAKATRAN